MSPLGWVQESVLRVLQAGAMTPTEVIAATGINRDRVNGACKTLMRRGLIEIVGQRWNAHARPSHVYALTEATAKRKGAA